MIGALQAYVIGAYIICLSTAYGYFTNTSQADIDGRFSGVGFHPDDFAFLLAVPIAWELAIRDDVRSRILRVVNMAYPIVAALTIVLTATRASVLVAIPAYLCIAAGTRRAPFSIRIGIAVAAVLGGAAIVFGHFSDSLNRLASVHGSSDAATMNGRVYLWNAAFDLIGKFPILGIGSGTFHTISATFPGVDYTETGLPAHNTYLSVFAELGAIGFLLFMAVIGAAIWAARHTEPGYRLAYLCSLAAFIIGSSALTYETHSQEWLLFILILAHCCMRQPRPITAVPVTT